MNEQHAQFFRELRELCRKYKANIYPKDHGMVFALSDETGYPVYFYQTRFNGSSYGIRTEVMIEIDAAQKEGEK